MNITTKRCLCVLLTVLLTVSGILGLSDLLEAEASDYKYIPFFEEKNDFDVLFMGTSHVINAVFPMELWNDHGITSYNFGGHANEMATTYWCMMNALDYKTPKLVVIDCFLIDSDAKVSIHPEYLHYSLDAFPLSITKIKTAYDLVDNDRRLELLWNFSIFHDRWGK